MELLQPVVQGAALGLWMLSAPIALPVASASHWADFQRSQRHQGGKTRARTGTAGFVGVIGYLKHSAGRVAEKAGHTTMACSGDWHSVVQPLALPPLLLGSGSAVRRQILEAAGVSFEVRKPDIDEKALGDRGREPEKLVRLLAEAKADALLSALERRDTDRLILTADQVVTCKGNIREKPKDLEEARTFVSSYAGSSCCTVGALCLHDPATELRVVGTQTATIHFKAELGNEDVLRELMGEDLLNCAGSLMVEHPIMSQYVERIEGGQDNVMGLSTSLLKDLFSSLEVLKDSLRAHGPVLGRLLSTWAVVGDVTNEAKPASQVVRRLEEAGRRVIKVSPYDKTGQCYGKLEDVSEKVEVVNLIISPKIGMDVLTAMKKQGIRYVFMQPGADAEVVVRQAESLGLVLQRGCVLIQDLPSLEDPTSTCPSTVPH